MFTDIVVKIINAVIDLLPDIDIPLFTVPQAVLTIINMAHFFLPMGTVFLLFQLTCFITGLRITLALFLRIKSLVPGWGN